MRNEGGKPPFPSSFLIPHFALRISHFAFVALILAAGPAAAGPLDAALEWSRSWTFGGSRAALNAVADLLPPDAKGRDAFASAVAAAIPSATPDARRFYCGMLGHAASPAGVEALSAAAFDRETSSAALMALQAVPGPEAARALEAVLAKAPDDRLRSAALQAMGKRGDRRAAGALRRALADSSDEVAQAAAWALIGLEGPKAWDDLEGLKNRECLRGPRAEACLLSAGELLAAGRSEEACRRYEAVLAGGFPGHFTSVAVTGLARARGERAIPLLLARLSDPSEEVRGTAARALAAMPGPGATAAVAAALTGSPAGDPLALLGILADRGDSAAAPAIRTAAGGSDGRVADAAIRALARAGTAGDAVFLATLAAEGKNRSAARDSLDELAAPGTDELILSSAPASTPAVAGELLRASAARRIPGAGPVITGALASPDTDLRIAAMGALEKAGSPADFPPLLFSLTRSGDDGEAGDERDAASAACAGILSRAEEGRDRLCGTILDAVPGCPGAVRAALLGLVRPYGGKRALKTVIEAVRGRDGELAGEAVSLLAEWPDPDALPELERLSERKAKSPHALAALRGTLRTAEMDGISPAEKLRLCDRAMRLASRDEERRMAVSVYGKTGCPDALKTLMPFMAKPGLQDETRQAVLSLAEALVASEPELAGKAADEVLKRAKDGDERDRARRIAERWRENTGYVTQWDAAGPFSSEDIKGTELFDVAFAPEEEGSVEWKQAVSTGCNKFSAGLDLKALFRDDDRAAYVRCRVASDRARDAVLELGSDDGVKAWLNGKLVHANNAVREMKPGDDRVPVALKKGVNILLLKVVQGDGDWGVCARFAAKDRSNLPGLKLEKSSGSCRPLKARRGPGRQRTRGSAPRR